MVAEPRSSTAARARRDGHRRGVQYSRSRRRRAGAHERPAPGAANAGRTHDPLDAIEVITTVNIQHLESLNESSPT
jgi:hypothetical protein